MEQFMDPALRQVLVLLGHSKLKILVMQDLLFLLLTLIKVVKKQTKIMESLETVTLQLY